MEFFKDDYRRDDHQCIFEDMRKDNDFTRTLISETDQHLSEKKPLFTNRFFMRGNRDFGKQKEETEKKNYRFEIFDSQGEPLPSTSRGIRSASPSTSRYIPEDELETNVEDTPTPASLSEDESDIPRLQKCSSCQLPEDLPLLPSTIWSSSSSDFDFELPVMDKKVLARRKIDLLSGRLDFLNVLDLDSETSFVVDDDSDSESETAL